MSTQPRYANLQDYVRVLRRRRFLIAAMVLVVTAATFLIDSQRAPVYQAEAALSYRDVAQDLDLIDNVSVPSRETADTQAAARAESLKRPSVAAAARRLLKTRVPRGCHQRGGEHTAREPDKLRGHSSQWGSPRFAARIANAYANVARSRANRQARARYAEATRILRRRYNAVARSAKRRANRNDPRAADDRFLASSLQERIARLESLREIAQAARIENSADVPVAPVSPRKLRDTVLGGLLGLTLGIILAFLLEALDRRVRNREELQEALGVPVLGGVSRKAMGTTALAKGEAFPRQDLEGFRMLRANVDF